eukprot:m.399479 g.399479  ORF g.399479 m.399479 type:complete len:226 (+) comp21148_c0_seq1:259-936(+)
MTAITMKFCVCADLVVLVVLHILAGVRPGNTVSIHSSVQTDAEVISIHTWKLSPPQIGTTDLRITIDVQYSTKVDPALAFLEVVVRSSPSYNITRYVRLEEPTAEIRVHLTLDDKRVMNDKFDVSAYIVHVYDVDKAALSILSSTRVSGIVFSMKHMERRQATTLSETGRDCNDTDDSCGVYNLAGHCSPEHTLYVCGIQGFCCDRCHLTLFQESCIVSTAIFTQ